MIIGVEQTTDMRYPQTKIVRFTSERQAAAWVAGGGGFAWPGAADETVRPSMQNWHRRLRRAYVLPKGYRIDEREVKARMAYPNDESRETVMAYMYRRIAVREIKAEAAAGEGGAS